MRTPLLSLALLGALLAPAAAKDPAPRKTVDLAVCLDTSGSMEGLIDAARRKIWSIVNDLATAKPTPRLRVALLAYGGERYDPNAGYVEVQTEFTEDLDLVSKRLFALEAKGSVELVGRVIHRSLALGWQADPKGLKLIVVAGNESADQDQERPFRDECRAAIARGIMINSLYCVRQGEAVQDEWREIARLSDGHYAAIDPTHGTVDLASPFDAELAALSVSLNATYVPFGHAGVEGCEEQKRQDANAKKLAGGAAAQRAQAKAGGLYWMSWCLVDATRRDAVKLEEVAEEDLPEELRGKTVEEIRAHLDAKWAEREKIQEEIAGFHKKRETWVAEELAKRSVDQDRSFDVAIRRALRAQAEAKGYKFEE